MKHRISIRDVAKKACVSVSSVSLAYHKPYQLSEKTRNNILLIAEELGYKPNQNKLCNALVTIALLLPKHSLGISFCTMFSYKISTILAEQGYYTTVIYYDSQKDLNTKLKSIEKLNDVRGVFIVLSNIIEEVKKISLPVIVISHENSNQKSVNIGCDYSFDIMHSIKDLCKNNKKRIAVVIPKSLLIQGYIQDQKSILEKFYKTHVYHSEYNQNMICILEEDKSDSERVLKFWQDMQPDAWIVIGFYAFSSLQCIISEKLEGYVILEENMNVLKLPSSKMIVLERPISEIAHTAFEKLLELIDNRQTVCSSKTIIFAKKIQ